MNKSLKTAWDLCGNSEWIVEGYCFRIKGGRAIYENAQASRTHQSVQCSRIDVKAGGIHGRAFGGGLHVVIRYIHPDTPIELVQED